MITNQEKEIATRIKNLRKKNFETQKKIAEAIGIKQDSISKIEQGTMNVTMKNLIAIAKHYHVTCDYICFGNDANTILNLLNRYMKLQFSRVSFGEENLTCPEIKISKIYFDFLIQSAYANANDILPKKLKEQWLKSAKDNFYEEIDNESQQYVTVIPVPGNLIFPNDNRKDWKQSDLLREIDHYLKKEII